MSTPTGERAAAGFLPERIGRYKIVDYIGKGAMGVVYGALDEPLDRHVAVKLMLADFDQQPDLRTRFYREARITGQLAHRNIVRVFDLGDDSGRPFIVMELLHGWPLANYLQRPEGQTIEAKVDLMMQVCDGLHNAHQSGVIHRDVKPSNMFVQKGGILKLLDFGVAKLTESNLTGSGFLVGTPEYMAPEQPMGRPVDVRSDVYSAACVFYYMLSGRSPFGSGDLMKMLDAIINDEPTPLTDQQAPDPVRRVLNKALAKMPEERYRDCREMAEALADAQKGHQSATIRLTQAAFDRYHQIIAAIEERRALGLRLGTEGIDAACNDASRRLRARFPQFARAAERSSPPEPMDRAAAQAALESMQNRHAAERAAYAALQHQAEEASRGQAPEKARNTSWRGRAATFVRGLIPPKNEARK